MPRRPEHLQRRDGTYYFRMPVPEALRPVVGKREFKRSLGTKDFRDACKFLAMERLKAQAELEAARRKLELQAGQQPRRVTSLSDDELWQLMSRWFVAREREAESLTGQDVDVDQRLEEISYLSDARDDTSAVASLYSDARRLLTAEGLDLDVSSPSFAKLASLIQEALIEHEKRLVVRFGNRPQVHLNPRFSSLTATTEIEARRIVSLKSLTEQFEHERSETQRSPTAKLRRDAHLGMIVAVLGEHTAVGSVTRDDAKRFRDVLSQWPSNSTKRFPGLSVDQVLALPDEKRTRRLKAATANAYLQTLSALFDLAVREGLVATHPARGLRFVGGGHSETDRHPFAIGDLKRIFNAPLYTGCENDGDGYAVPGVERPRGARFWIPLVALFTGLRLGEICMLRVDDLVEIEGIPALLIRADDPEKSLKTKASERLVPVHPELQKLGLLTYARRMIEARGSASRLFPDLTRSSTGYTSNNFSKWFARFLDSVGVKEREKTFHSFRHTFRDAMDAGGVPPEIKDRLGGWAARNTAQRYGGSRVIRAKLFAPEIAKVGYPGLDLSHLHDASAETR